MCHKVESYNKDTLTLTLDSSASTLAINDIISIDGGNNYPYCAKITAISGNTITVDKEIVDYAEKAMNPSTEDHLLYVDGKPNTGTHPLGEGQIALGLKNHAIAKGTTAAGRQNYASGGYSVALGRDNKAANYSVAIGRKNKATGFTSVAIGYENETSAKWSAALGNGNIVSGVNAFASGVSNTVSGNYSIAVSESNTASGGHSFAGGRKSIASSTASFAYGYDFTDNDGLVHNTEASGSCSVAFGQGASSSGPASFSSGFWTQASGNTSVAFGYITKARGDYSFAIGYGSQASGKCTAAVGKNVTTNSSEGQMVVGRFNDWQNNGSALFVVGNGQQGALSNAFKVMSDGSATLQTMGSTDDSVVTKAYADSKMDKFGTVTEEVGYNYVFLDKPSTFSTPNNVSLMATTDDGIPAISLNNNNASIDHHNNIHLQAGWPDNYIGYSYLDLSKTNGSFELAGYDEIEGKSGIIAFQDGGIKLSSDFVRIPDGTSGIGGITVSSTGVTISSPVGWTSIMHLAAPENTNDAVPKYYVDNAVAPLENISQPMWKTIYSDHTNGLYISDLQNGGYELKDLSKYRLVIFGVTVRNTSTGGTRFYYTSPAVRYEYGTNDLTGRYDCIIPCEYGGPASYRLTFTDCTLTDMLYDAAHDLFDTVILKQIIGIM